MEPAAENYVPPTTTTSPNLTKITITPYKSPTTNTFGIHTRSHSHKPCKTYGRHCKYILKSSEYDARCSYLDRPKRSLYEGIEIITDTVVPFVEKAESLDPDLKIDWDESNGDNVLVRWVGGDEFKVIWTAYQQVIDALYVSVFCRECLVVTFLLFL